MRRHNVAVLTFVSVILWPVCARAQAAKTGYSSMAPLDEYLIRDEKVAPGAGGP